MAKGRQALLDYLRMKTDDYDYAGQLSTTGGGGDFELITIPACERPLFHSGYDVFGVHWSKAKPSCHYTQGQEPIVSDIEDWREDVHIPKISRLDWDDVARQAQQLDRKNKVSIVTMRLGPFERTTALSSFEDCLVNAISEPEEFKALIEVLADYKIAMIDHLYRYAKPDVINLHDDWGTSQSTFISPELWREVVKPATKRMYDAIHTLGMIAAQHSCGNITSLLDDLVEIGCDAWEVQADVNDVPVLEEKYAGKLRIISPPPPPPDPDGSVPEPSVEDMPLCFRPYPEKPTFLWV
jgi:hypothetical protein